MKIGVVGMGSIGQRHAGNARRLAHEVKTYDPAGVSDFKREGHLYDWCDAAVICTPSMFHEGPLRACIERGKHVLMEKPISTSVGALRQLLTEAAYKQLTIMMGNNLRFHPCVVRAKQWIDSGALGKSRWATFICATEWTSTAQRDGVILNTGSHEVDVALYLFGPAVVEIATTQNDVSADFVLQHDGGVRSTFHIDIDTTDRVRQFWISGAEISRHFDLDRRTADSHIMGGSYGEDYMTEMKAFIDRVEDIDRMKNIPGATGEEGLETLLLLLDIRKKVGLP